MKKRCPLYRFPGSVLWLLLPLLTMTLDAQTTAKTLLNANTALYARLVRTTHSANASLNGRIVASVTAFSFGVGEQDIYSSTNGVSFTKVGAVQDADFAGGLCCGTLYELPKAVGALPAGTLIWAGSVGQSSTTQAMKIKVYDSQDGGATWSYLSTVAVTTKVGSSGGGLWEPQFTVATDGALVVVYSDETNSSYSQYLHQMRSYDGVTWQDSTATVASSVQSDRPGMAVITQLPSGTYFMTYELCGPAACTAFYRTSSDGWNWGTATNTGTKIQSTTGQYFEHAPTNAWASSTVNANGTILVTGQMLYESNGTVSSGNGETIFVNHSADGSGTWTTMPAPVAVPTAYDNYCPNYSSPLLPSTDGQSVLEFASDYVGATCVMYYATGAITGGTATATVTVTPAAATVTTLPINVQVTVTGQSGQPTGTVTLTTGSWSSSAAALSSGVATIALPAGSLSGTSATLTASYSGDANFAAATGSATVAVAATALPALTVAATAVSVTAGSASGNTSTVTVTPVEGFTGTVNLTATLSSTPSNAVNLPTLSFGTGSAVTVSSTSAVSSTLTVTTEAATTARLEHGPSRPVAPVSFAALIGLLALRTRRRAVWRKGWLTLLLMVGVLVLPGCGGGGAGGASPVTTPGTSSGAYVVTVTANSGSTTATTTFNLTVN